MYVKCDLLIFSEYDIEEVAARISAVLSPTDPLTGLEDYIYEEIPAMYVVHNVLGFEIILQGYGGEQGYLLQLHPPLDIKVTRSPTGSDDVDIAPYIAEVLQDVEGITVRSVDEP